MLDQNPFASQHILSRFWNRKDADAVKQFEDLICKMRSAVYSFQMPEQVLYAHAKQLEDEIAEVTKDNMIDYVVRFDEFLYQASKWDSPNSFIITNRNLCPEELVKYSRNRGTTENFIKEGKHGFDFASTPSNVKVVNTNHLILHVLVYNLFNCFK